MLDQNKKHFGFSLIELMIVVAILSILAAIAWPSYRSSVLKSHRADGREAVLSAAAQQEQIYMQRNLYTADIAELGGEDSGEGYYTMAVTRPNGNTSYLITATARGSQAEDTGCASFTVNQAGLRKAYDASDSNAPDCW
jgi:prepilin-type N-terminal cleavage/methylation domain